MGEKRNTYRYFLRKPKGNKLLGRPRHWWQDNIKIDLREDGMVWTLLIWLRIGTSGGPL
jgi:hypothetical protein